MCKQPVSEIDDPTTRIPNTKPFSYKSVIEHILSLVPIFEEKPK